MKISIEENFVEKLKLLNIIQRKYNLIQQMSSSSERSSKAVALRTDSSKVVAKLNENIVKINRKPVNVLDEDTFIKVIFMLLFL
jgi:hypothetical protein